MCSGRTGQQSVEYKEVGVSFGKYKAEVCLQCGEQFFDENVAESIQQKSKKLGLFGLASKTKVAEIGNSFAIRIPKEIASFLHLKKGKEVSLVPQNRHDLMIKA